MMVLVDTSVWSLALRRRQTDAVAEAQELARLISDMRVQLIGPIRQEILSGIKTKRTIRHCVNSCGHFPICRLTVMTLNMLQSCLTPPGPVVSRDQIQISSSVLWQYDIP